MPVLLFYVLRRNRQIKTPSPAWKRDFKMIFSKRSSIIDALVRYAAGLMLAVLAVNFFFPGAKPEARIEASSTSQNYEKAAKDAFAVLSADPMNIRKNRKYLMLYKDWKNKRKPPAIPQDLIAKYEAMAASKEVRVRDLGAFCVGFIYLLYNDNAAAIKNFEKVSDKKMPFLNNAMGSAYFSIENYEKSIDHDYLEIAVNPDFKGAYANLGTALYKTRKYTRLAELLKDPKAAANINDDMKSLAAFHERDYPNFIRCAVLKRYGSAGMAGVIGNLIILAVWVLFIRRLDILGPRRAVSVAAMLALAMAVSLTAGIGYRLMWYNGFDLCGDWKNDLIYCVFGVGIIEETIKILPFLIFLVFTRRNRDTFDYISCPALAGLGFAFIENLIFFSDQGLTHILPRSFSSVIMHMSLSVMAAHGFYAAKYEKPKNPVAGILFYFFAAVVLHGVYDFFVNLKTLPRYYEILAIFIFLFCMIFFGWSVKTAIKCSKHFDAEKAKKLGGLSLFLILSDSFFIVTVAQYMILGIKFGSSNANAFLTGSAVLIFYYLLLMLNALWIVNMKISDDKKTIELPDISAIFR